MNLKHFTFALTPWLYFAAGLAVMYVIAPRYHSLTRPVPQIVTVYDTVRDTVKLRGPKVVTTDTLRVIEKVIFHDTVQVQVPADTGRRPVLWPVLNAQIGKSRGDTTTTTTFSLRSGRTVESRIWTPGPLKSLWADSTGTPRLDFYEPNTPKGTSTLTKLLWSGIGFGVCKLAQ